MMENISTATFIGRTTSGTGVPEALTVTQATALLNSVVGDTGSGGTKGLVPAPAAGDAAAGKFLKADGTWTATAAGSGTVTSVSIVTANGFSGSVANATTTPAITLSLAAGTITASQMAAPASLQNGGTVGGTANAITLTPTPALGAYTAQDMRTFLPGATNTSGTVTVAVSGLATRDIKKFIGGAAVILAVGDLIIAQPALILDDGTKYILMNPQTYTQGADVASATTTNIDTATGDYVHITGTTTITGITLAQGRQATVEFTGALTFTNGVSLILPGGANITTAAGDTAILRGEASGVVRCIVYTKADGTAIVGGAAPSAAAQSDQETATSTTTYVSPGRQQFHPSAAKCWGYVTVSSGTPTLAASNNITSITDAGLGLLTVTIATDHSSANYAIIAGIEYISGSKATSNDRKVAIANASQAAGTFNLECRDAVSVTEADADPAAWHWVTYGDQ
jgi:hypothetical protein